MDVMTFLKTVPAVIGIAGLFAHFMRVREPVHNQEVLNLLQGVRNAFVVLTCAALIMLSVWLIRRPEPPNHDAALPMPTTIGNTGNHA